MERWRSNATAARWWHATTAAVALAALGLQLVLVIQGGHVLLPEGEQEPNTPTRVINFFSFFTVQSNMLLVVAAATLAVRPNRDGPVWRVVRIAGLLGIAVTGAVYVTLLRPLVDLDGLSAVANAGLHYLSPILAVAGWLLFGPWPRVDRRSVVWSLVWPVAWLVYTLARGAAIEWYPYPFIDVSDLGYGRTLLNSLGITVLLLGVGFLFAAGDRFLRADSRRSRQTV